jgi:fructokinase
MATSIHVGVDLGGTKIEALALTRDGRELLRRRVATPSHSLEAIVAAVRDLVLGVEHELGSAATVGVATPGSLSPVRRVMRNSNTVVLNGAPLDELLAAALAREVRIANDANCFALSEATDGAGAGQGVVFGVILGTGTGGGVVVDGRPLVGANAIAGEWGHNPLPWGDGDDLPAPACYCGKRGCIETYLSGPALERDHRDRTGEALDARAIASRAQGGDAACAATLARYLRRLGKALASVVNVVDPDVIVLGGGVSNIEALYAGVVEPLAAHVFSDVLRTQVLRARHGDSSGVRGAAWLWGRARGE